MASKQPIEWTDPTTGQVWQLNPKGHRLDEKGREIPDSTPIAPPIGLLKPPTITEQIRSMIRSEKFHDHFNQGHETFEEADDFDIPDDDVQFDTDYEAEFEPVRELQARKEIEEKEREIVKDTEKKAARPKPPPEPKPREPEAD